MWSSAAEHPESANVPTALASSGGLASKNTRGLYASTHDTHLTRRCQGSPWRSGAGYFHGVQVVEVGVQVRVHQDRGVEGDGEGQVEVEREVGEDQGETLIMDGMQMK